MFFCVTVRHNMLILFFTVDQPHAFCLRMELDNEMLPGTITNAVTKAITSMDK